MSNPKIVLQLTDYGDWAWAMTQNDGSSVLGVCRTAREALDEALDSYNGDFDPDPGEMDGDHQSALASAGMGTDEDYGGQGNLF